MYKNVRDRKRKWLKMITLKDTVYTDKERPPALPIYCKKATGAQTKNAYTNFKTHALTRRSFVSQN